MSMLAGAHKGRGLVVSSKYYSTKFFVIYYIGVIQGWTDESFLRDRSNLGTDLLRDTRPTTRPDFNKWYSSLADSIENGLPPVHAVVEVDSADFKTELRLVYATTEMCTSFVRRVCRLKSFAQHGFKQILYVDRDYIESTLSAKNEWKRSFERNGKIETERYSVEKSALGKNGTKRAAAQIGSVPVKSKDKGWNPSPERELSGEESMNELKEEEDSDDDEADEFEQYLIVANASKKAKKTDYSANRNFAAIKAVENIILQKQLERTSHDGTLRPAQKKSDSKLRALDKEIANLMGVSQKLRVEKKKLSKEKVAEMMNF